MSELDKQLKKGVLSIIILKMISRKEMYGYELIQELDAISDGFYKLKEGTLYPILYRLEDSKWIESYRVFEADMKIPRKYYKITNNGLLILTEYIEEWKNFNRETNKILIEEV